jgi:hypothetical protein
VLKASVFFCHDRQHLLDLLGVVLLKMKFKCAYEFIVIGFMLEMKLTAYQFVVTDFFLILEAKLLNCYWILFLVVVRQTMNSV